MGRKVVTTKVTPDKFTNQVKAWFDLSFTGESSFTCWSKPEVSDFSIGLIVGPSGSGKSLLLKEFGQEEDLSWDDRKAIISQFNDDPLEACDRLMAVGFNDVRSFVRPYHVLSTGEQFRASLARKLKDGAVIDEFTSVVDRNVAKAASVAMRRYVTKAGLKNIVLATCHRDVLEWIQPDWYFDTTDGTLHDGRLLRRPPITIRVYPCSRDIWGMFAPHHYLSHVLASAARCFLATAEFEGKVNVVGFVSSLPFPSGSLKRAWREHRTVVLPDFQGLGVGPRISDAVAMLHCDERKRYFSRTAHPRFGAYRDKRNSGWMRTSQNKYAREQAQDKGTHTAAERINSFGGDNRLAFSHEYVGRA
jgi:ABC-type lipoprotein export system ATPase subunit